MLFCIKCGIEKPDDMFKEVNRSTCKSCLLIRRRELHAKNKHKENARSRAYYEANKNDVIKQKRQYQKENFDKVKAAKQKWNAENSDRVAALRKARRLKNVHRESEMQKIYVRLNKDRVNATVARRRARKIEATPAWANEKKILIEYELALWCSKVMKEPYHVDHIVPLQSKIVCGLHCEANLQVIRRSENARKGNRIWPDMPN